MPYQIGLWASQWSVLLIDDLCGWAHSTGGGDTPRVVLGGIRNQAEKQQAQCYFNVQLIDL